MHVLKSINRCSHALNYLVSETHAQTYVHSQDMYTQKKKKKKSKVLL